MANENWQGNIKMWTTYRSTLLSTLGKELEKRSKNWNRDMCYGVRIYVDVL